jgi:hypothetical protein
MSLPEVHQTTNTRLICQTQTEVDVPSPPTSKEAVRAGSQAKETRVLGREKVGNQVSGANKAPTDVIKTNAKQTAAMTQAKIKEKRIVKEWASEGGMKPKIP